MGFVKMVCPNCGANFDMNPDLDFGVCNFCGTRIAVDRQIIEHRGEVIMKGDVAALHDRAMLLLEDSDFSNAKSYCIKALDIDPRNYKTYVILLMSETKKRTEDALRLSPKPLNTYNCFHKAIRFAPNDIKKRLNEYDTETTQRFDAANREKRSQLAKKKEAFESMNREVREAEMWTGKFKLFMIIFTIAAFILSGLLFRLIWWAGYLGLAILVAGIVFLIANKNKGYKILDQYDNMVASYNHDLDAYNSWLHEMQKQVN
jgi:hypothetical protein